MKPTTKHAVVARAPQKTPGRGAEPREGAGGVLGALRTVTMPLVLPMLTLNTRLHWGSKQRAANRQHAAAKYAAMEQHPDRPTLTGRWRLDVTIRPHKRQPELDTDNAVAAIKHYRDGLAAAFGIDDKHFSVGALVWDKDNRTGEIVIALTQEEA